MVSLVILLNTKFMGLGTRSVLTPHQVATMSPKIRRRIIVDKGFVNLDLFVESATKSFGTPQNYVGSKDQAEPLKTVVPESVKSSAVLVTVQNIGLTAVERMLGSQASF